MGDFRQKNILQIDFKGKHFPQETPGGKIPTLKKKVFHDV